MSSEDPRGYVKIEFEIEGGDVETMWAIPLEEGYCIDNIPFYARGVAWGDVVRAVPDSEGRLRFEDLVTPSGHSTVRLWFATAADVIGVRNALRKIGCGSELDLERLVAVDIPAEVEYSAVRTFLDGQEKLGVLEYEEGCIAQAQDDE
jgi:Domain of unknown function (DUF4265)